MSSSSFFSSPSSSSLLRTIFEQLIVICFCFCFCFLVALALVAVSAFSEDIFLLLLEEEVVGLEPGVEATSGGSDDVLFLAAFLGVGVLVAFFFFLALGVFFLLLLLLLLFFIIFQAASSSPSSSPPSRVSRASLNLPISALERNLLPPGENQYESLWPAVFPPFRETVRRDQFGPTSGAGDRPSSSAAPPWPFLPAAAVGGEDMLAPRLGKDATRSVVSFFL
mmetsp:Transcript_31364/g.69525  ORF Transcript_31364/g.69525 Transcript_31364/m.69525 type:complete len:223 (+) Transcript_31364:918-1586(+)